jgi:hypothetical protein
MNLTPINKNVSRALLLTASLMTTIVQALFTSGAGCAVVIPVAVSVTINCISSTTERGGDITGLTIFNCPFSIL